MAIMFEPLAKWNQDPDMLFSTLTPSLRAVKLAISIANVLPEATVPVNVMDFPMVRLLMLILETVPPPSAIMLIVG